MRTTDKRSVRRALQFLLLVALASAVPWYEARAQTWRESRLYPADGTPVQGFGSRVALSQGFAMAGAPLDDDNGQDAGAMYVYKRAGGRWIQWQKLLSSDREPDARFGGVSIYGQYMVVGAAGAYLNGIRSGAVYIFKLENDRWVEKRKIGPGDGVGLAIFGLGVSIDGDRILVGAPGDGEPGYHPGAAYVFERRGEDWIQKAKLVPPDPVDNAEFGYHVSLLGEYALVGAPQDSNQFGERAGSAYLFHRRDTTWFQEAKLTGSIGGQDYLFGRSVFLDSAIIAVGSPDGIYSTVPGSVHLFARRDTLLREQTILHASDGHPRNLFGSSLAISGARMIVGAPWDNTQSDRAGAAYLFSRSDTSWKEVRKFLASDGALGAEFGGSCALEDTAVIVGAPAASNGGVQSGEAYILEPQPTSVLEHTTGHPFLDALNQNYPNPFNSSSRVTYRLSETAFITLVLFDILGRRVATLDEGVRPAGTHAAVVDGNPLPSGVYFCRLHVSGPGTMSAYQIRTMLIK